MSLLTLKISLDNGRVTKGIQFENKTTVFDACRIIRDKFEDIVSGKATDFGLFWCPNDNSDGIWLDAGRSLSSYALKNRDVLDYRKKIRVLRVKTVDDSLKTIMVDDSLPVSQQMPVICAKIGIADHDEYGLVRETGVQPGEKVNRDAKMETLRKKAGTDDEVDWLDMAKTLRDQGVGESETVLLKRKYFFFDQNIDSSDPVQLNLLYVQTRKNILEGKHPVTQSMACKFAGLQAHIQFGNFNETKHVPGFLILQDYIPACYVNVRNIEIKIFDEHKKLINLPTLEAKTRYAKTARELPTYGVTFFLVKEKQKGRNKLIPRLLGVTKDSIIRLDETTKEFLETWPLATVFRWGASPSTFTLDFGSSDYSVQTSEGEQIKNMIGGYIDIIIKNRTDELESAKTAETQILPPVDSVEKPQTSKLTQPQRALLNHIVASQRIIADAETGTKVQLPKLGNDPGSLQWRQEKIDVARQMVTSYLASMNADVANYLTASQQQDSDEHQAMGVAISQITQNIPEVMKEISLLTTLLGANDPSTQRLLHTKSDLCNVLRSFLTTASPESKEPHQNLLKAATRLGEVNGAILNEVGDSSVESKESQNCIFERAQPLADKIIQMMHNAKSVVADCNDEDQRTKIVASAAKCALATSQLLTLTRILAPTINNPACRQQLESALHGIGGLITDFVENCTNSSTSLGVKDKIIDVANEVPPLLNALIEHLQMSTVEKGVETNQLIDRILVASDMLVSTSNTKEVAQRTKQTIDQLIESLKNEAEQQDDLNNRRTLLSTVEELKQVRSKLEEAKSQEAMRAVADELRTLVASLINTPAMSEILTKNLASAAKDTALIATQCISSMRNASKFSDDTQTKVTAFQDGKACFEQLTKLIAAVKAAVLQPDNTLAQLRLIDAADGLLESGSLAAVSARDIVPTVMDQQAAQHLAQTTQDLAKSIHNLRPWVNRAREACSGRALESVVDALEELRKDFEQTRQALRANTLYPLPGGTAESAIKQLKVASSGIEVVVAQLHSGVQQADRKHTEAVANNTGLALEEFTKCVREVAATTQNPLVVECADQVIRDAIQLIKEVNHTLQKPQEAEKLDQQCAKIKQSLAETINCLPGIKDIVNCSDTIKESQSSLKNVVYEASNRPYSDLQQGFKTAVETLNTVSGQMVQSYNDPVKLAKHSQDFEKLYKNLLVVGLALAKQTQDEKVRNSIVETMRDISTRSANLMAVAKKNSLDPEQQNSKNEMASSARMLTETINQLADVCTQVSPGVRECDNAIRSIEASYPLLESAQEPLGNQTYFECLDAIMENSQALGYGLKGLADNAEKMDQDKFGMSIDEVSKAIRGLIEVAAHAAYLVGISNTESVATRPGIIDQSQIARAAQNIRESCDVLQNQTTGREEMRLATTNIAKQVKNMCTSFQMASHRTNNLVAKRHFNEAAKQVAELTSNLARDVQQLDQNEDAESRQRCVEACRPLLEAVEQLLQFASSHEFGSRPAQISPQGRVDQEPIIKAARDLSNTALEMVTTCKQLSTTPTVQQWQKLAKNSKSVSERIKRLAVNMRDRIPGRTQCEADLEKINQCARDLNLAAISIGNEGLPLKKEQNMQGFTGQVSKATAGLLDSLEPLSAAAKNNAENLGNAADQVTTQVIALVKGAIGVGSHAVHSDEQSELIDQAKTVVENVAQLMQVAKKVGGNPKASMLHSDLEECVATTREMIAEFNETVERLSNENGVVTGLIEQISRAISKITDKRQSVMIMSATDNFVNYQTRMVQNAKEIARHANDVNVSAAVDPSKLGTKCSQLVHFYEALAQDTMGASATAISDQVSVRIESTVQNLGHSVGYLVQSTNRVRSNDASSLLEVSHNIREVSESISQVLAALQDGSRGTQACINAASTLAGIVGDLDTTIMFVNAGILDTEEAGSFAHHRKEILQMATDLVKDTKSLVSSANGSQEQLADAAQGVVATMVKLSKGGKLCAASLGSNQPDCQMLIINSVKDVVTGLGETVNATKMAAGKPANDPKLADLQKTTQVLSANITSLLKILKAVDDDTKCGKRAMEATAEAIMQKIQTMKSATEQAKGPPATPEDLIQVAKNVSRATTKVVEAGASKQQSDISAAAIDGRKAILDLLSVCRSLASEAGTTELKEQTINTAVVVASSFRDLSNAVALDQPSEDWKDLPRKVADSLTELVGLAQSLKGSDWVNPEDPSIIAESEMNDAAVSIEAAAQKLASLKPRYNTNTDENTSDLNFDDIILETAKSVMTASTALIRSAEVAQNELAVKDSQLPQNGQWAQGFNSAAQIVATSIHNLVEAAQNLVKGVGTEEMLISSAKQVASSTAQLLIASKVKSVPNSMSGQRLQTAGNAVIKFTDNLVKAAQKTIDDQKIQASQAQPLDKDGRVVKKMREILTRQAKVLQIEKELENARRSVIDARMGQNLE